MFSAQKTRDSLVTPFLRPKAPSRPSVSLIRGPRLHPWGQTLPWPRPLRTAVTDPPATSAPAARPAHLSALPRSPGRQAARPWAPPGGSRCGGLCMGTGLRPACLLPPSGPVGRDPGQNPPSWVGALRRQCAWWPCRDGLRLGPPEGSGCCRVGLAGHRPRERRQLSPLVQI